MLRLVLVDQVHQEEPAVQADTESRLSLGVRGAAVAKRDIQSCDWRRRLQVVGQVVLLQGVRLEAVGGPVEVVVPDAADETFSLGVGSRSCVLKNFEKKKKRFTPYLHRTQPDLFVVPREFIRGQLW